MGNCLDIPPPPPKRRPFYFPKPHYILGSHTSSIDSVESIQSPPNAFTSYQPYAIFGGSRSLVNIDGATGQTFSYPVGVPVGAHPYYAEPIFQGDYSYYEEQQERVTHTHKRQRGRERRSENGDVPHRNGKVKVKNVNSTLITTFPDPTDDIIKRGHEIIVSSTSSRSLNGVVSTGVISTVKDPQSTTTTSSTTTKMASSSAAIKVTNNQSRVVQSHMSSAPVATRGSTYVTYIQEESPAADDEENVKVEEEDQIVEEESTRVQSQTHVTEVGRHNGGFRETGDADEGIVQLFVDDPITQNSSVTSVTKTSSRFVHSESLKKMGRMQHSSQNSPDVVICYGPRETDVMVKIKRELESAGFSVVVSNLNVDINGDDFTDWLMFPQAIIDAKLMVVLLSTESVKGRQQRDEVSLAHLTDTCIFPVSVGSTIDILSAMDIELKLQLASYQWTELSNEISWDVSIDFMIRSMQEELEVVRSYEIIDEDFGEVSSWAQRRQKIVKQRQLKRVISFGNHVTAARYWDKTYASEEMAGVSWDRFYKDLRSEYREALSSSVPKSCTPHLIDGLKRELGVESDGLVHKAQFLEFCSELGTDQDVWERIRSVAREVQAIRDVFDKESTVRLVAIENIGKLGSHHVMSGLRELLTDQDPNIRAVATVSLSRCMLPGDTVTLTRLVSTLDDKEKLVREAGCVAMGHLGTRQAVEKLNYLRHNDVIPHVREAAAVALNKIGGSEENTDYLY